MRIRRLKFLLVTKILVCEHIFLGLGTLAFEHMLLDSTLVGGMVIKGDRAACGGISGLRLGADATGPGNALGCNIWHFALSSQHLLANLV